jgi:hypothetical protein
VFGIGFHKTGTTSLGAALSALGYRVCDGARPLRALFGDAHLMRMLETNQLDLICGIATEYDAFRDNPWYLLYGELDRWFPNSRFILTTRDERRWLRSALRYFGGSESAFRRWIYGKASPLGNEEIYLERFRRHERDVRDYFADRPGDLLVVDWEQGDGWSQLTRFLQKPIPNAAFPWANATDGALDVADAPMAGHISERDSRATQPG